MLLALRRFAAVATAASALLLSGCLLTPGKFESELVLKRGGAFSYSYTGEISMMGLKQLSKMGGDSTFEPECVDGDFEERPCTKAEVAEQKAEWEAEQAKDRRDREQFAQMIGGIDPADPESVEKMAEILRKQSGWEKVEHKGDGLFDVRFAVSGNLTHGFVFPLVEKMPMISPFVTVLPRADGSVRVEADAFGGEAMPGMPPGMGMLAAMGAAKNADKDTLAPVVPDGSFTIVTNGRILANNTEDGPEDLVGGQMRLSWKVDSSRKSAPMALVALD